MNYFSFNNDVTSELIYGNKNLCNIDLSIVIPTYKRNDFLRKTIQSINKQKNIRNLKYEVLIVSNDPEYRVNEISDILNKDIFKVYRNKKNLGMVGNMNRCALLTTGKYISYIQDDDILLDEYIKNIEELICENKLDDIDCLIPNRYYYYDQSDKDSVFGEFAYKKEKKKELLKKVLSVGKTCTDFQKITTVDCANTWFNCYGGGPTCGMLFKRSSLLNTKGFSCEYPYAFDFVFFMDFSDKYNVVLYNRYLSIYRMTDSASNKPEVQKDFFESDMRLLEKTVEINRFVSTFKNEIIRFSLQNKSIEAQKIIKPMPYKRGIIKYVVFRVIRFVNLMRSNVYRRKLLPLDMYRIL